MHLIRDRKTKCARTIRTHFCFYKITTNSRTAVILPSSASFEASCSVCSMRWQEKALP